MHEKQGKQILAPSNCEQAKPGDSESIDLLKRSVLTGVTGSLLGLAGCISEPRPEKNNAKVQSNNSTTPPVIADTTDTSNEEDPVQQIDMLTEPDDITSQSQNDGPAPTTANPRTFAFLGPSVTTVGVSNLEGQQVMSDGKTIYAWGFQNVSGAKIGGFNRDRLVPSPVIELIEGEQAAITLSSQMPHSIHFHGLDVDQANDGVPLTSGYIAGFNGVLPGNFGRVKNYPRLSSPFEYTFLAPHAGTYMYHCHVDTVLHLEMGMAGTIIVRPPNNNAHEAWAGGPVYDKEYIWQLHTYDSTWHQYSISNANTVRYRPDYFMINGRDGADLLSDTTAVITAEAGQRILLRGVNIGSLPALIRLADIPFEVISSDGRPLKAPIVKNSLFIGAGERYDLLFTMPASIAAAVGVDYFSIFAAGPNAKPLGTAGTTMTSV